jgi:ADP-heptose:LPS heptosyltransferase
MRENDEGEGVMAERILVMSLTRMGDLVQATPLISGLKEKYPYSKITLMVSSDFESFIPNIPDIDDSIVLDMRQFKNREQGLSWVEIYHYLESFLQDVKTRRYDLVVNLSHSKLSAFMILYLEIKKVCGFLCNATGDRMTEHPWMQYFGIEPFNRTYNPFNLVEIFTRSADIRPEDQRIRIQEPDDPLSLIAPDLNREAIRDGELLIGIQAGSSLEGRRWPARYFAELADSLANGLNARIVLFGVASESPLAEEICRLATRREQITDLTGKTDLPQLIAWVGLCRYLVTNDTGTMHIAAALGTTIVGLFFAHAHPYETGPYSPGHVLFQARISCAPCSYGVQCNHIVCIHKVRPHHLYSMMQTHVSEGAWRVPESLESVEEMNIYETRYGNDRRLTLKPLTLHPIHLDDVFRWAYSSLWLESLATPGRLRKFPEGVAGVELLREDYDCSGVETILEPLREKIRAARDSVKLSREGEKAATSLIKLLRSRPSPEKMQALGEKISSIDEKLNLTGGAHPELKPVIDIFAKRKENFQGDDVVRLGNATLRCYEQMRKEFARLIQFLNAVEESFSPVEPETDQAGVDSIKAFVPGR